MRDRRLIRLLAFGLGGLIVILLFSKSIFITIDPGERGVLFKRFGGGLDTEHVYGQGFHFIAPWNKMYVYNVREQFREETMDVLSSNGLTINVDVSVRYRPEPDKIGYLHDQIGPNYEEKIVRDLTRSSVRKIIGRYTPEELYATRREEVQDLIQRELDSLLARKYIVLEAALIRSVKLPPTIEEAIQSKLEQEQEALKYEFKLQREEKEAQRKRIEAEGIRKFQEIVSQGLSQDYLRWKGIEATTELANSPNTKVVIIGNSEDGLPLILGGN